MIGSYYKIGVSVLFLRRIFNRDCQEYDDYDDYEDQPDLFPSHNIDVFLSDGTFLLSGVIDAICENTVMLKRAPGSLAFPLLELNLKVSIRGYGPDQKPFCYHGFVRGSERIWCEIRDLEQQDMTDKRDGFRIRVDQIGFISKTDAFLSDQSEACKVVDLGAGGACIESDYMHGIDEVVYLKIEFGPEICIMTKAQVIWKSDLKNTKSRYGLLFPCLDDDGLSDLTGKLYKIQAYLRKLN